ncbi:hypothetical protein SAMN02910456_02680 [Ruminococcaceae bacterium YRB3002]|nr:hypothetical protein SAMN02910456_02680 [Ruminococcaceae bacterium YRB3002]
MENVVLADRYDEPKKSKAIVTDLRLSVEDEKELELIDFLTLLEEREHK